MNIISGMTQEEIKVMEKEEFNKLLATIKKECDEMEIYLEKVNEIDKLK